LDVEEKQKTITFFNYSAIQIIAVFLIPLDGMQQWKYNSGSDGNKKHNI